MARSVGDGSLSILAMRHFDSWLVVVVTCKSLYLKRKEETRVINLLSASGVFSCLLI